MGRVLLMEPISNGPYKCALRRRGAGLHHIALDMNDLDGFIEQISGSGWLLHPKSIEFYKSNRQIYLCRPQTKVIMEIQERKNITNTENFYISQIEYNFLKDTMVEALNCDQLKFSMEQKMISYLGVTHANS